MISDRSSAQNCPTTLIGHSCKDSFLPNSNQLMEHLVPGIIDQNKSYKDAGIDLARVQKHHRPPAAAAEELQQNPLQPAAWNYRVIMGPIQAGLDPACHTEPRSLISFFPTREPALQHPVLASCSFHHLVRESTLNHPTYRKILNHPLK